MTPELETAFLTFIEEFAPRNEQHKARFLSRLNELVQITGRQFIGVLEVRR